MVATPWSRCAAAPKASSAATTFVVNSESTYNWDARQWSVPINAGVTQVLRLGDQLVQVGALARHWVESPTQGPQGWGFRFTVTLLFPR